MALSGKSLFLYGFQVTELNSSVDFRSVALETPRQATLRLGYYSLTSLCTEIKRALQIADPSNVYTLTVDRTVSAGLENRVTIATSGTHFELLFGTGPRAASSVAPMIGFAGTDRTGALTYTGTASAGTVLTSAYVGFNYTGPEFFNQVFGNVNVSASGQKEAIVYAIQKFVQVEFRYEAKADIIAKWTPFMTWAIQQRKFEFTPELGTPGTFYEVTLDKTEQDGKGLGFRMPEILPGMPNLYRTGALTFRLV